MSFNNVGKVWTTDQLPKYLTTVPAQAWARAVTLHHTAAPSLAQRPLGLLSQHIINIQDFYQNTKGWKSGPHFFVDDHGIHGMTPPTEKGTHAVSFNGSAIGIEVLGDYDNESPVTGRGLVCWRNAALATKALLQWLGVGPNQHTVLFHRDDPKTSKTCPGKLVGKDWVMKLIKDGIA